MDCSLPLICPLLSPRVCSNSCLLSRWCYLTISSSTTPFSFCLQSFPASFRGSFPVSQLFISGCQNLELQLQHQSFQMVCWGCFPLGLTELTIQKIIVYLTFWGSGKLFSKMALLFIISTYYEWQLQLLHIITNTFYYLTFDYSHPSSCEVISFCGFNLHFPIMTNDAKHLCMCL